MMRISFLYVAALFLPSCGDQSSGAEESQAKPVVVASLNPGLYRQDTTLLDLKDPSLTEEQLAAVSQAIGTTQSAERCITAEMVGDPQAMLAESAGIGCSVDRSIWEGGRVDIQLACPARESAPAATLRLAGTYDADSYKLDMKIYGSEDQSTHMRVDAKRLGDCTPRAG